MKLKPLGSNQTEVTLADGTVVLFSYETPVAAWIDGLFYKTEKNWSRTTSKHVTQWLRANGGGTISACRRPQSFFDQLGRAA